MLERDAFEANQYGGITVEVGSREEDAFVLGEERLFLAEVADHGAEHRALRCPVAERLEVGFAQRPLPGEQLVLDPPLGVAPRFAFARLR